MARERTKGVSLAKGPVALLGIAMIVFGVIAFISGGSQFDANPIDGTANGKSFLGLELNSWSSLLFVAGGLALVLSAPLHWGAKSMALIVGLVFGAASVIAIYDGDDVFGIFAADGLTELVWGALAIALIVLSLLPRVGKKRVAPEREGRVHEPPPAYDDRTSTGTSTGTRTGSDDVGSRRV